MFCRKCGAELRIKAGAKFCGKCGTPIRVPEPKAASVPKTPEPSPSRSGKSVLISSMPRAGSSGSSSNGEADKWFSDPGDL